MVVTAVANSVGRGTDGQTADVELAARAVTKLGSLVADLIHGRKDVVGELHLRDRCASNCCHADSEADEALLVDRHVEHTLRTELVQQAHGATEDSTEGDIFAKHHSLLISGQGNTHGIIDGSKHRHLFRLPICGYRSRPGARLRR